MNKQRARIANGKCVLCLVVPNENALTDLTDHCAEASALYTICGNEDHALCYSCINGAFTAVVMRGGREKKMTCLVKDCCDKKNHKLSDGDLGHFLGNIYMRALLVNRRKISKNQELAIYCKNFNYVAEGECGVCFERFEKPKKEKKTKTDNENDDDEDEDELLEVDPDSNLLYCICENDHSKNNNSDTNTTSSSSSSSSHYYCYSCLNTYLTSRIKSNMEKLACPHSDCCKKPKEEIQEIDSEILSYFVGIKTHDLYVKLQKIRNDSSLRECSNCENLIGGGSQATPELTCSKCHHSFCFIHGDAHGGNSCAFSGENVITSIPANTVIFFTTRTCPTCQAKIVRNGGCPNMTCQRCQSHFCYYCGSLQGVTKGSCSHFRLIAVTSPITVPVALTAASIAAPFAIVYFGFKGGRKLANVAKRKWKRAHFVFPDISKYLPNIIIQAGDQDQDHAIEIIHYIPSTKSTGVYPIYAAQ